MSLLKTIVLGLTIGFGQLSFCQTTTEENLKILDAFIDNADYISAKVFAKRHIDSLIEIEEFYELTDYIYYLGKAEAKINGTDQAVKSISDFENHIKTLTKNPKDLRQLCIEIGSFYEFIGDSNTAKDYNLQALEYTKKMPEALAKDFALIQSNLGVFYFRLGDIPTGMLYHRQALKSLKSDPTSSDEKYYITYNALGGMMWYASKFDSAIVYYQKAEKCWPCLSLVQ